MSAPFQIYRKELLTKVVRNSVEETVRCMRLVHANEQTIALLANIERNREIAQHWHLAIKFHELRHLVGDKILPLGRHDWNVCAGHPRNDWRPKASGNHHVLGDDIAFVSADLPFTIQLLSQTSNFGMTIYLCALGARGASEGVGRHTRIKYPFVWYVGCAENTVEFHQRMQLLDLVRTDHVIVDAGRSSAFRAARVSLKQIICLCDQD